MDRRVWSEPSGSARLEQLELADAVQAALATLSAEHRQVLVLKEMEGLGYAEIAHALGIASGTVASRLYNARAALKKTLVARGITLEDVTQ
jgi:RNA polymerase sigma-70 factor (ECF subfamily)